MRLSDVQYSFMFLAGDWRELARCRETGIEMLPGGEADDQPTGPEVQLAKQTCASCPVVAECRAVAGTQPGVWGGLTKDERDRMRLDPQRQVIKCETCGYSCVPTLLTDPRCDDCLPDSARPQSADEFEPVIVSMIQDQKTYREIALTTGLTVPVISKACRVWGTTSRAAGAKNGSRRDRNGLAPCGTPAARRRHQRRGEDITSCACAKPGSWNPDRTIKNGWVA